MAVCGNIRSDTGILGHMMNYIDALAKAIKQELDPAILPSGDTDALFRLYAVLVLAKGESVSVEDVHDAWAAWMSDHEPTHEAIRPYKDLDLDLQNEANPFLTTLSLAARKQS